MDEKRIEQVLEIENQAQAVRDAAQKEADQIPRQAEEQCQVIVDKNKADAEEEARQIIEKAKAQDESNRIIAQAEKEARNTESLAKTNFDRTVAYVLNRVIGKE